VRKRQTKLILPFPGFNRTHRLQEHIILVSGLIGLVAISLLLNGCTRATIPIDAPGTVVSDPAEAPLEEATPQRESEFHTSGTYAVVWTSEEDTLKLRVPAGIAGSIVDELEFDSHGVSVTGNSTNLGSSLWVEIQGPDGEMGWVNSWNLTEDVMDDDFCADPRILTILEQASQAFIAEEADGLLSLVNPKRGLILRHDWWNPEVIIRTNDIANLYISRKDQIWGTLSGGDFAIEGSFTEIFSPLLLDVLSQTPTAVCGDIPSGVTSMPVVWPGDYTNLHFYAFHRPNPEGGNRFDWRTMVFGFEYIQGEPYLTLITHYHGDV
jgi:hypothetical protein